MQQTTTMQQTKDPIDAPTEDGSMYEEYFYLTQKHKKEQGPEAVVLYNCGIFYEMYGYGSDDGTIIGSDIEAVSKLCDLALTEKSKLRYHDRPLYQAGFRDFVSDKFLDMIIEGGYTAVMYGETNEIHPKTKKKVRKLEGIHSAGTYVPSDTASIHDIKLNNHMMVLWLEQGNFRISTHSRQKTPSIVYGLSILNVYNGKTYMYEQMTQEVKIQSTTFDELEKNMSIFSPSEIVIIHNLSETTLTQIQQFVGMMQHQASIHTYGFDRDDVKNSSKQSYQRHILSQQFGDQSYESCEEFQMYPYATQSFCYLLHFVQSRNANLIKHIDVPIFYNKSQTMILANHTLRQLNILQDHQDHGRKYGHLSSVSAFLNKCISTMGKRKFQYILTHPSFDETWLQQEYTMMKRMLEPEHEPMIDPLRKTMSHIRDMEKTSKWLLNRKLLPVHIYQLYDSIQHIQQINVCLYEMDWLTSYLCPDNHINMEQQTNEISQFLESKFQLDKCKASVQKASSYDENLIQPGVSHYLDETLKELATREEQVKTIENFFNRLYTNIARPKKPTDVMKINTTEKHLVSLQITKTRSDVLKTGANHLNAVRLDHDVDFHWKEVQFNSINKTTNELCFPFLDRICKDITRIKTQLNTVIHEVFLEVLHDMEDRYYDHLNYMSQYIASLDVLLTKCHLSHKYHYCSPVIVKDESSSSSSSSSFVKAKQMRHVLIEQLQQDELYVANDITLGSDETNGILLYGTNAVGKSSFIKSLGICVIMAQAGMFVPCQEFHYKPYKAIYSRIIGNDNLFKGLSTYAVEISELRTILNNADSNSLVLGDELCSGTETVSALSVVMASLIQLHRLQASFILASHFHELVHYDELKTLTTVKLKHMEVWYDKDTDALVYDRKVKDGSGQRTYGLEVCKSLYFPDEVLSTAYEIRRKYHPEFQGALSQKQTHYNTKKIKDACELCGSSDQLEIHHLQEQHKANYRGFIEESFHKNHPANLLTLCEACHLSMHHPTTTENGSIVSKISEQSDENGENVKSDDSESVTESMITKKTVRKMVKKKTTKGMMLHEEVIVM